MKFRLIVDGPRPASENMACDYACMMLCKRPVLRLYSWQPAAVSIGRFQDLDEEVDLDYCRQNGIDVVRRITGGGAVYHEGELTYSLCIPEKNPYFDLDLHKSYEAICGCIIAALTQFGLKASYAPINDILINGRKVSGCAQTRKKGIILHHGTLLITLNKEKMFKCLKVLPIKLSGKPISQVKDRVTCLSDELGKEVPMADCVASITTGFEQTWGIEFVKSGYTDDENRLMKKAKKEIFENEQFLHER